MDSLLTDDALFEILLRLDPASALVVAFVSTKFHKLYLSRRVLLREALAPVPSFGTLDDLVPGGLRLAAPLLACDDPFWLFSPGFLTLSAAQGHVAYLKWAQSDGASFAWIMHAGSPFRKELLQAAARAGHVEILIDYCDPIKDE